MINKDSKKKPDENIDVVIQDHIVIKYKDTGKKILGKRG